MKIGILTSSRADYGIYRPLLEMLEKDDFFDLRILAFGTHLCEKYNYTLSQIISDNYKIDITIDSMPIGDSPADISFAIGKTIEEFSKVWKNHKYDLVIALGDRYEMFAAVISAMPYNIKIAHLHGGETTLGAIDNVFRHSISLMSNLHFTATEIYKYRVAEIIGETGNVYNVGALSIDNIKKLKLLSKAEFKEKFNIDLNIPSILITFHPETVNFEKNEQYIIELIGALKLIPNYQLIITMPNADTMGLLIREKLFEFVSKSSNAIAIESFGNLGYLSCLSYCSMIIGNTSSGFIEAAGFNKPVVNIGDRQKGRILTPNIFNSPMVASEIITAIKKAEKYDLNEEIGIYGNGNTAQTITEILKKYATNQL